MVSTTPIVSVVLPTFNRRPLLARALGSVAAQTFTDWECLICDDGSTDGTLEYLADLSRADARFRLLTGVRFGRPSGPRNRGIRAARGEWIALLDDDDVWHPQKLEFQMRLVREQPCQAVSTRFRFFLDSQGAPSFDESDGTPTSSTLLTLAHVVLFRQPYPCTPSNMIRRDVLLEVGGFDEAAEYRATEDFDLWCRLLERPGLNFRVLDGMPLTLARDEGADSISNWTVPLKPDFIRQRWATLAIVVRMLARHPSLLDGLDRSALLAHAIACADDCAARSYQVGWRRVSFRAYVMSAMMSAKLGDGRGALTRIARAVRFGALGAARAPAPVPDTVRVLAAVSARSVRGIIFGKPSESAAMTASGTTARVAVSPPTV